MAVSGSYYAPGIAGAGSKLVNEVWQKGIEAAVYEEAMFFPEITEADRLYNKLHIRKIDRFAGQTLASTAGNDGTGLSYGVATDTEVTITPVANYVAVAMSRNQIKQMNVDARNEFKDSVNKALAQQIDVYANSTLVPYLTTNVMGDASTAMDRALTLNLLYTIRKNARSAVQPGVSDIKFIVWPNQGPAFMSIPEFTAANLRGDGENPNVKGIVFKALGLEYIVSGNLATSAGAICNPMFVKSAFAISWNERPTVMEQEFELQNRIIAYANYGVATKWEDRAGVLLTKSTI